MNGTETIAATGQVLLSAPDATVPLADTVPPANTVPLADTVPPANTVPSEYAVPSENTVHVSRHLARPGHRTLVIADLADLRGPVSGTVELPIWLFWQPNRTFDLDDPAIRRWVYQIVLREATRPEDLTTYLNGEVLAAIWPELRLPRGVRRAWDELHPSLALFVAA